MKQLPNLLTSLNLFCGVLAIVFILHNDLNTTLVLLLVSLIADVFDGLVARLVGSDSDFGKELDSLADMVSFGVVPGLIMAMLIQDVRGSSNLHEGLFDTGFPWMLTGLLVSVFSALRLAKFNLDTRQTSDFYGLPTPSNTVLIYAYWMIYDWAPDSMLGGLLHQLPVLILLSLVSCYLLIADVRLMSLKVKDFSWKGNVYRYILLGISIILLLFLQYQAIPIMVLLYILLSLMENWQKK